MSAQAFALFVAGFALLRTWPTGVPGNERVSVDLKCPGT
jgi:hypothetical protein